VVRQVGDQAATQTRELGATTESEDQVQGSTAFQAVFGGSLVVDPVCNIWISICPLWKWWGSGVALERTLLSREAVSVDIETRAGKYTHLLSTVDQTLLDGWDTLLLLDLLLDLEDLNKH
jgi:hypothetical protein